jgi:hypothetical protein
MICVFLVLNITYFGGGPWRTDHLHFLLQLQRSILRYMTDFLSVPLYETSGIVRPPLLFRGVRQKY